MFFSFNIIVPNFHKALRAILLSGRKSSAQFYKFLICFENFFPYALFFRPLIASAGPRRGWHADAPSRA